MADIIFEEITPYVEGEGDNGKTAREKINRNFDKLKGFDDAVTNIDELQGRDEPIVFTDSKAMNSFIKTLFVDKDRYEQTSDPPVIVSDIYASWSASSRTFNLYRHPYNTNYASYRLVSIGMGSYMKSVYCFGTTDGTFLYIEVDTTKLSESPAIGVNPSENNPRPKLTSWATSKALDPRTKDGGFTESPTLNKYIKKLWVEIKDDFTGDPSDIVDKLTVYLLKSYYDNGEWKQYLELRLQTGNAQPIFRYESTSGDTEIVFTGSSLINSDIYKNHIYIHAVIDWIGLLQDHLYDYTRTYLTHKAYDVKFWGTLLSDSIGDDSEVAFSQKGAKALSYRIDLIQDSLSEKIVLDPEDLEVGYWATGQIWDNNPDPDDRIITQTSPNSNGTVGAAWRSLVDEVKKGDIITLYTKGGNSGRAWALTDKNKKILSIAISKDEDENNADYRQNPAIIIVQENGFVYVNHGQINNTSVLEEQFRMEIVRSKTGGTPVEIEELQREIEELQEDVEGMGDDAVSVSKTCNPKLDLRKPQLRVLDIGNSFTSNPTAYLGNFVSASGIDVSNMCLYAAIMSGASFKEWYNVYYDTASYSGETKKTYSIARLLGGIIQSLGSSSGSYDSDNGTRLRDALETCQWDLILIHQVSGYSTLSFSDLEGDGDGGYLREFVRLLRTLQPSATIGFLFTHVSNRNAAAIAGTTLRNTGERFTEMAKTTKAVCSAYGIDFVIPVGAAIENLRVSSLNETDYNFSNDNHHLADGLGKYVAAAAYFEALFAPRYGKSVYGSTYLVAPTKPEQGTTYYKEYVDVTQENAPTAQMCAVLAVNDIWNINNPDNVTPPQVPSRLPFVPSVIMPVVSKSTSNLSSPLAVELGKYNKCSISSISTYPIVLPSMSDTSAIYELYIYIEVAAGKSVQITSADNKDILLCEGFFSLNTAFQAAATYEIKASFNGAKWMLTAIKYS